MAELDAIDRGEDGHGPGRGEALAAKIARVRERRQAQEAMLGQLTASGESQVSLTDPDARDGHGPKDHGRLQRAGGGQCEAQADRRTASHQRCHRHGPAGGHRLGRARDTRRRAHRCRGGHGLLQGRRHRSLRSERDHAYVARPERGSAVANGRFPKERFTYDPAADAYHRPGGGFSTPATARSRAGMCRSSIPALPPVPLAPSGHAAPEAAGGASTVGRTRRCSSAWPGSSPPGPAS